MRSGAFTTFLAVVFGLAAVSCAPHTPPRAPGIAPPAAMVDERRLLAELDADGYHGARIDHPAPATSEPPSSVPSELADDDSDTDGVHAVPVRASHSTLRITIPRPVDLGSPVAFLSTFAHRYATSLAFGVERGALIEGSTPGRVILADSFPQRDAGCVYVFLRLDAKPGESLVIDRECLPMRTTPPSYRARPLPSTANGPVDVLARCGSWGNGTVASYSGFALDKFGDVYEATLKYSKRRYDLAWADGQENAGGLINVLYDYVRTMPPSEVDQLMRDVAAAEDGATIEKERAYEEPRCTGVVVGPPAPRSVYLDPDRGGATKRARVALLKALR